MIVRRLLITLMVVVTTGDVAVAQTIVDKTSSDFVMAQKRPALLIPLYASQVTLHAADLYTTLLALEAGNREMNPLFKNAPFEAMIGAKAVSSVVSIVLAEKLWKKRRVAAVTLMIATNVGVAAIAAHNYRLVER
jgi:hypothetical protein